MARKRVNKKLAIIGSAIMLVLIIGAIAFFLLSSKDPYKFMADAEAALAQHEYQDAIDYYGEALGAAGDDTQLKIDIYFILSDIFLTENEHNEINWKKAVACWQNVVNLEPKNVEAREKLLDYFYQIAKFGQINAWRTVETNSDELLDIYQEKGQPASFEVRMANAQAKFETARYGQTSNRLETVETAIAELEELLTEETGNYEIYNLLSDSWLLKGMLETQQGLLDAEERAREKAKEVLTQAAQNLEEDVRPHVDLLNLELNQIAKQQTEPDQEYVRTRLNEVTDQFEQSPEIYIARASYFRNYYDTFDEALDAIQTAMELRPQNVEYALMGAHLLYQKFQYDGDRAPLEQAIELTRNALTYPNAQEVQGPREFANKSNRLNLYSLLTLYEIERGMLAQPESEQRNQAVEIAEETIHEIEQLYGTADNVYVTKWRGLLEHLKGNDQEAVRMLYSVYEDLVTIDKPDIVVSTTLNELLRNEEAIGLRRDFLASVIRPEFMRVLDPKVLIDYAKIGLELRRWNEAAMVANFYERHFRSDLSSQSILAQSYVGAGMFEEAREVMEKMPPQAPETVLVRISLLNSQINRLVTSRVQQSQGVVDVEKISEETEQLRRERHLAYLDIIEKAPKLVEGGQIIELCNSYLNTGQRDLARELAQAFLKVRPDHISGRVVMKLLDEKDENLRDLDRRKELMKEVAMEIGDEKERAMSIGQYYEQVNDPEQALEWYEKALAVDDDYMAMVKVFDLALSLGKTDRAKELADRARRDNLDECEGNIFLSQLDIYNDDFESALDRLNRCLDFRPINGNIYFLRSQVHEQLGNQEENLADLKQAVKINPLNGRYAASLAVKLYQQTRSTGAAITPELRQETEQAIQNAIVLNPTESQLQSMYATYISDTQPEKALAIVQSLRKANPNLYNNLMLGRVATNMAMREGNYERKQGLYDIAGDAFAAAYELEAGNTEVLQAYAEYLRLTGQTQKAEEVLSSDKGMLWQLYVRDGQYDKAGEILEQRLAENPDDLDAIKGMLNVSRMKQDTEAVQTYCSLLLEKDDSQLSKLLVIQTLLEVNLLDQAQEKLAAYRQENPDDDRGALLNAWATIREGNLDDGLNELELYLEDHDENAQAWSLKGQVHSYLGEFNKAIDAFERSEQLNANPETQIALARAYVRAGRITEAIARLNQTVKNDQAPPTARGMLEELYLTNNRTNDLVNFYNETLKKYPDSPYWHYRAGSFYYNQESYENAYKHVNLAWKQLTDMGGSNLNTIDLLMELLRKTGRKDDFYKLASQNTDSAYAVVAYSHLAQDKAETGGRSAALDYYYKALDRANENQSYIYNILDSMTENLGPREVANWCRQRLSEKPDELAANLMMYELLQRRGDYHQANEFIDNCIRVIGDDSPLWPDYMGRKANTIIGAYLKTSDKQYFEEAVVLFERILERYPDSHSILNNLAYLLADNNQDIDKAIEYAQRAHEIVPNNANYMDTLAYAMIRNEQYDDAIQYLQRAIQVFDIDENQQAPWDLYYHLGMAQEGLGDRALAAQSYQRALDEGGNSISAVNRKSVEDAIKRISM